MDKVEEKTDVEGTETTGFDGDSVNKEAYKAELSQRLAVVLDQKAEVEKEEKALKAAIKKTYAPDERIGLITRTVQTRFKENDPLCDYLKDNDLWRAVTVKTEKVMKDKVDAVSEDDPKLRKLFEECLVESDRVLYDRKGK